ncbi:unnamed protein product [Orchesella dallaii]|uniref:Uncharacterized protein n=1 Tax=Orchesella dallaii TaxID=48710 RepID=A0ABP1RDU8_9HEXA
MQTYLAMYKAHATLPRISPAELSLFLPPPQQLPPLFSIFLPHTQQKYVLVYLYLRSWVSLAMYPLYCSSELFLRRYYSPFYPYNVLQRHTTSLLFCVQGEPYNFKPRKPTQGN